MREIKFRGYDGMDWIYGSAVRYDSYTDTWYMIENGAPDDDWVMVGEVGQYTGLKDVNGKEIYEGDVLHMSEYGKRPKKVYWHDQMCKFFLIDKDGGTDHLADWKARDYLEVIGNIHDNQELIKNEVCN
jgi:uncharacterized phage protein (TIGR01671 family)